MDITVFADLFADCRENLLMMRWWSSTGDVSFDEFTNGLKCVRIGSTRSRMLENSPHPARNSFGDSDA